MNNKARNAIPDKIWKRTRLAVALALVAGYVDSYAYLVYRFYVSVMSGNTTQTGLHLTEGPLTLAAQHLLPIVSFVAGVFAATLWLHSGARRLERRIFAACAGLLALSTLSARWSLAPDGIEIVILAVAMGALNTTFTNVGNQTVHIAYITNSLNNLAQHLALAYKGSSLPDAAGDWDTHARRAALLIAVWFSFLAGAFLGSTLQPRWEFWTLLPPIIVLGVLATREQPDSKV